MNQMKESFRKVYNDNNILPYAIFPFLSLFDLKEVSLVSKTFHKLVNESTLITDYKLIKNELFYKSHPYISHICIPLNTLSNVYEYFQNIKKITLTHSYPEHDADELIKILDKDNLQFRNLEELKIIDYKLSVKLFEKNFSKLKVLNISECFDVDREHLCISRQHAVPIYSYPVQPFNYTVDKIFNKYFSSLFNLVSLNISNCLNFSDRIFNNDYSCLQNLEELYLYECYHLSDEIFNKQTSCLHNLKKLHMSFCDSLTDKSFNENYSCLGNLTWLDISFNNHTLTDEIFNNETSCLRKLKYLNTDSCYELSDKSFDKNYSCLNNLEVFIHGKEDNLTDEIFDKDSSCLGNLRELELQDSWKSDKIFDKDYSCLQNLQKLVLYSARNEILTCEIFDRKTSCLNTLKELHIIHHGDLNNLIFHKDSSCLQNLQKLLISGCPNFSDEAFDKKISCLGNLKYLTLYPDSSPPNFIQTQFTNKLYGKNFSCLNNLQKFNGSMVPVSMKCLRHRKFKNHTCLSRDVLIDASTNGMIDDED